MFYRRRKRKYTKKNRDVQVKNNQSITEKRRGRKKKDNQQCFRPDYVIDFMIRNYPLMGIEKIRENVLIALKTCDGTHLPQYVLDVMEYDNKKYYYDKYGCILDTNGQLVGHSMTINNELCIYMYSSHYKEMEEIMSVIESIDKQ